LIDGMTGMPSAWETNMLQDCRFALRIFVKSPSFTAVAILSLTLGIGANTAMFSVVHAVVLSPLPYRSPDQLVALAEHAPGDPSVLEKASPANYLDWKHRARSFAAMAAYIDSYASAYNLTGVKDPERVRAIGATDGFFATLGVTPMLGRELLPGEVRADRTLVLSYGFWMRKFGGDPNVIGTRVSLTEEPHTIIGVLPADFRFRRPVDLWRQGTPEADQSGMTRDRSTRWWSVVARLRPEITIEQAQAEMSAIASQLSREHARENAGRGIRVSSLHHDLTGSAAPPLGILYAAVCLVLLIACANVAGLLVARLAARHREIGVRLALGASRARLARQLFVESLLLAMPAAGAGLLLAAWLVRAIVAIAPSDLPRLEQVAVNGRIVLFTAALSVACAVLFGLTPIVHAGRVQPAVSLRHGRTTTPAAERVRLTLIVGEMALALVLLVGAGLLLRTYSRLNDVDPGFAPGGLASIEVAPQGPRYFNDWNRVVAFYEAALSTIVAIPGVRGAAVTNLVPFGEGRFDQAVAPADRPTEEWHAEYRFVSPGYFATMNIPLHSGRSFTSADGLGAARVAILGTSTAVRLFGGTDPVGKTIVLRGKTRRVVVGTVADTHLFGLRGNPPLQVYAPFPQADDVFWTGLQFVMRTDRDPLAAAALARDRLLAIDPDVPPFNVQKIDTLISRSLAATRMYAATLAGFAALALLLACAGLYGLIAYLVTQRTQEFGIRLALGASASQLRGLVLRDAARLIGVATVIGGAIALVGSRALTASLFGVAPGDSQTFIGVSLLLIAVAFAASYVPARRAMRVDPLTALRAE
jgi:putative ABC transport system permease protein